MNHKISMRQQMQLVPQLILTLSPSGDLVAEIPGRNGARRKLTINALHELRDELLTQREAIIHELERKRAYEASEAEARRKRVWRTSAERQGQGIEFADKIFGRPKGARVATKQDTELALLLDL